MNVLHDFGFIERRRRTQSNKIRRFLNDYWIVPMFVLSLELFAVILPPSDSPVQNFLDRNLHFFRGPAILYNIVTNDFPNTLVGHFKEIVIINKYFFNIDQVPSVELLKALKDKEAVAKIYRRVIESRSYHNTEIGGIVTLMGTSNGPKVNFYEIPSVNEDLSERLHELIDFPEEFLLFIKNRENKRFILKVGMDENLVNKLTDILTGNSVSRDLKIDLINGFVRTYDLYSESKYILSPYVFKSFLGQGEIEGEYIGIFHVHNNYMEPPSEADVANSFSDRQFVITIGDTGIVIYDVVKGKEAIYKGDLIS
ncbi:MAG: hypothetical protein A2Y48_00860 [Nitrospirae bacterium RIFCSPLOW2_12_42_9]|nr:MAG: hypothetical protein A2Y48_00860 [Nitrospirae bacterium RIFCSPLOW2_12_42_9]